MARLQKGHVVLARPIPGGRCYYLRLIERRGRKWLTEVLHFGGGLAYWTITKEQVVGP